MKFLFRLLPVCILLWLTQEVYSQKVFTQKLFENWQEKNPDPSQKVAFTVWLVGELGADVETPVPSGLQLLYNQLANVDKHSAVVFLGNQVSEKLELEEEKKLLVERFKAFEDYKGKVYMLSGNQEWDLAGKEGIKALQDGVEELLGKHVKWAPKAGCGKPHVVELNDWITLVLMDSQWFYDLEYPIDNMKGCSVDNREEFTAELEDILDEYNNTDLLIATHHPFMSGGSYGGYASWKDHFVPFPVVGSAVAGLKSIGLNEQYLQHPHQGTFADLVLAKTAQLGHIIFASAHDKGLQYIKEVPGFTISGVVKSDRHFIVSGGLSEGGYIRKRSPADFGYRGTGFSKLVYLENGEIWMEMWGADGSESGKLLFRQQLKEKDLLVSTNPGEPEAFPDTFTYAADTFYNASKSQRKIMGNMYRDAWTTPLNLPTLNLSTAYGGLVPIKKGGGIQSKSLRLLDKKGQQYVIRSVKKDVSLLIPKAATQTFLQDVVQDALSMSHPYGAWVVPPLADAAGVYHTNPEYFYVPQQPALGDFNGLFGDQIYLFEERPEEPDEGPVGAHFGGTDKITSTPSMLRKRWEDPTEQVDAKSFLRARMFDNLIGDWDRHEDQWRWAEFDQDSITLYRPIPRDRDQVFLTIDGALPWIVSREWGARMFQSYGEDIRDLIGQNLNAKFLDRLILSGLSRADWQEVAKDLQAKLTDEVLEQAFDRWPEELYKLNGEDITGKFKARRENFLDIAMRYYDILAKEVDIVGSDETDRFLVERLNNNQTRIRRYSHDKGDPSQLCFDRSFLGDETKEIRLYGLKGKDTFEIQGKVNEGIRIRIIGGPGEDHIQDISEVSGKKSTLVYDLKDGTSLVKGPSTRDLTENSLDINNYVYKSYTPNAYLPLIYPGFNIDDGITLGASVTFTNHGFRAKPFKSKHFIGGDVAFQTGSFLLKYTGDYTDVWGKWDFHLESHLSAPRFVVNYFGLGNETEYTEEFDEEFDFNRVRIRQVQVYPALRQTFNNDIHTLTVGPIFQSSTVQESQDRFVATDASGLVDEDFENKNYGGLLLTYELDARDNPISPRRGYQFNFQSGYNLNLGDTEEGFGNIKTELALYHYMRIPIPILLASRVGYNGNFGDYEFFQAATLGRTNNLRGFRRERFSGDQAFYHNLEFRLPFARTKNYFLPVEFGLLGFFDYGRVWLEGEDSERWHRGYGGGIVLSPFSAGIFTLTYERSREFDIIGFRLGFLF
ncbi:MAG: BamA/TamA family outer membrane protein [Bacteroidota bacterium]